MTSPRRGLLPVIVSLAALGALLVGAPQAQAASETLQVNREVNTVAGGTPVTLTARLSANAVDPVGVTFTKEDGPAAPSSQSCTVAVGSNTCQVVFNSTNQGTSLIRAQINGRTPDPSEGRLANTDISLFASADCRTEDEDLALIGGDCRPQGAVPAPGTDSEPDDTDVVQITWTSFIDGHLDCDDSNPANGEDLEYNDARAVRNENYSCVLTSLDNPPVPIAGAKIDGERLGGVGDTDGDNDGTVDLPDFCTTGADGRCSGTVETLTGEGATTICFWAEPGDVADNVFSKTGTSIDGGDCDAGGEPVDEAEGRDITDAVLLDISPPRAIRLDAGPESVVSGPGARFSYAARVWDQFDNQFMGDTEIRAEYFASSPLDSDGNTPASPDATCRTGTNGQCSFPTTAAQAALGTNLVCIWIETPESSVDEMIGNGGETADGSCGDNNDNRFDEVPTDPSSDGNGDTLPQPVTDGRDIIRLKVESRPFVALVKPEEKRQTQSDVFRLTGSSFYPGARITVSGTGVNVGPTSRVSEFELAASFDVAADALPGLRDVIVTNYDGGTAVCGRCFNVVGQGYWLSASDGGIFAFGDAKFAGSTGDKTLNKPIVGMASTPSGKGYWLAASDGGIFAFGDAFFYGSTGNVPLNKPIVGIAAHPSGRGYWLVASDGGIFAFGDAKFYGSTGRLSLTRPIVGIAAHPSGRGYWLVAADGGIFAFGDAGFHGSTGAVNLNKPVVGMGASGTGKGYWLVASDGGIFAFGDAAFHGSTGAVKLNQPIVGMLPTPLAKGYWLVASDGGIFAFGDAGFHGSTGAVKLNQPIIGFARR